MARQTGARAQAALVFESTYGTAPGSGYRRVPFATTSLGAERPLLDNEMLGFGRDPLAPQRDAITVDGDFVIPMDLENIGLWLKAAFGQPVTAAAVAATGSITFSAQPTVNSTVTINGIVFTFVASGATGTQSNIGGTLTLTLSNLATVLNASVNGSVTPVTYSSNATQLLFTHDTLGHGGNAFTIAASTSPASFGTVSAATLTGGANTHTFQSGAWTLPSMAIEVQMPEVPRFAMYTGVMVNQLQWSMQRSGLLSATVGLMGQAEAVAAATAAGALTALNYTRFGHFNGSILRDSVALATIVSADITYSNNLDPVSVIRADGNVDGLDPMVASLGGQLVARFADTTLFTQAIAGTPCRLDFSYSLSASASLLVTAHAVYLPQPKAPIEGPGGVQATFDWQAALAVSPARMATVVLTNGVASY
jgi:hypothetical protein